MKPNKNAEGNLNAAGLKAQEDIKIAFCRSASADVLDHLRFKRENLEAYLATHRRLAEIQAMENYLLDEAQLTAHYPPIVALTEYEILKSFLVDYLSSFDYLPGSISNKCGRPLRGRYGQWVKKMSCWRAYLPVGRRLHLKSASLAKLPQQNDTNVTFSDGRLFLRGVGRRTENTISLCFALRPENNLRVIS